VTDVTVLGAGPAGLAAALELAESGVSVTVIEQQNHVGGNATSFDFGGVHVDYGSHRLHPASPPRVLERIRSLLGEDLLTRPRHGRIRLMGRWIHFPLRPVDLLLRMHPRFATGVGIDLTRKLLPGRKANGVDSTFATILEQGLGKTICNEFYFPYARKIWGIEPEEISPIQAYKRVSAGSIGKMLKRLMPGGGGGGGASTKGIFYYPRYGFGQISQALLAAAIKAGARVHLGTSVSRIRLSGERPVVEYRKDSMTGEHETGQVYSTIPVTLLSKLVDTNVPDNVRAAAESLEFRSMVLVYLLLDQDHFTEYDAHYFPGKDYPFTRISETKNYSDRSEPAGRTSLCAEVPCFIDDTTWKATDEQLARRVSEGLELAGLPITSNILEVRVKRIPFAYPLFTVGYEEQFSTLDQWVDGLDGILSFGRQGLYVHDNTHHAIYMAQAAVECLRPDGTIDRDAWHAQRKIFETHVVED
jgi:protoporphyrinogen oxidase